MRTLLSLLFLLLFQSAQAATPILDKGIAGVSSKDSIQDSLAKLNSSCESVNEVEVEPPSFPLAATGELHLICKEFDFGAVTVEKLAVTFADQRLVMLYAEGNATEAFLEFASEPLREYLHFTASFGDLLVADRSADQVWVMSADVAHPNLFQWRNPYIDNPNTAEYESSAAKPEILGFSKTLQQLLPEFEEQCAFTHLGTYDVWLLNRPELQQQIDCFGFEYAGFPRKIEAVFGDGILEQAWILTGKGEESRVREALVAEFGDPTFVNDKWEVFHNKQVMLRKDKPEVLMLSAKLAELYFDKEISDK